MRRIGIRVVGLSFAGVAACSLPNHDNPNDPQNRPIAALTIRDAGTHAANPGCASLLLSSDAQVSLASRGDCLYLDAGASRDPHGAALQYDYDLVAEDGTTVLTPLGTGLPA